MKALLALFAFGLYHGVFFGTAVGQTFNFEQAMMHNETCGASSPSTWSIEGSVSLTSGLTFFQPKLVIQRIQTLCSVDLATCSAPIASTSHQSCSCSPEIEDSYNIRVNSKTDTSNQGMAVQAVVPGNGWFRNIFAATTIGKLPMAETHSPIKVSYKMNDDVTRDLADEQVLTACPYHPFKLEICVLNNSADAQLKIELDLRTTTVIGGSCIAINHEFTSDPLEPDFTTMSYEDRTQPLTETRTRTLTFEYNKPGKCTNRYYIHFKGDSACRSPTTPGYESYRQSTEEISDDKSYPNSTPSEVTPKPQEIPGICPDTPRTPRTLEDGMDVLMDEHSRNTSWIIFQRRVSWSDFYRPWDDYVNGFGDITDSFWMGLKHIHKMCNHRERCELLIHLAYPDEPHGIEHRSDGCYFAYYSQFWIGGPAKKYRLKVGGYRGTAGDSLMHRYPQFVHRNQPFTTYDRDHDNNTGRNCAKMYNSAWWYNDCYAANLNGKWGYQGMGGVGWTTLTGVNSATFAEMKLRRYKDNH